MSNMSSGGIDPGDDDPRTHGVIHINAQIVLYVGMTVFYTIAIVGVVVVILTFSRFRRKLLVVGGLARTLTLSAVLGSVYMYTAGGQMLWTRIDSPNHIVLVRAGMIIINGVIQVLLVYTGGVHCVLLPTFEAVTVWLAAISAAQTTAASFIPATSQWPGWLVGSAFLIPVPFIWIAQHRRADNHKFNGHTTAWVVLWLFLRVCYALIQLTGHTFAAERGLGTQDELALMLVLHFFTLCILLYTTKVSRPPPVTSEQQTKMGSNGDVLVMTPLDSRV